MKDSSGRRKRDFEVLDKKNYTMCLWVLHTAMTGQKRMWKDGEMESGGPPDPGLTQTDVTSASGCLTWSEPLDDLLSRGRLSRFDHFCYDWNPAEVGGSSLIELGTAGSLWISTNVWAYFSSLFLHKVNNSPALSLKLHHLSFYFST